MLLLLLGLFRYLLLYFWWSYPTVVVVGLLAMISLVEEFDCCLVNAGVVVELVFVLAFVVVLEVVLITVVGVVLVIGIVCFGIALA